MEFMIKKLIEDLKTKGKNPFSTSKDMSDTEAKVNVWYVIAKLEEILLEGKK